jgi:predicted unusual protein kinase regulating ubiquinone biosynthesis (AarF/ABC1/UbiB family)
LEKVSSWQEIARRYRVLALEMGGVLIKLGQFLSIRVDILPSEVTRELAGLQDEVPPERPEDMATVILEEFGRPPREVFERFRAQPEAAASLAQVHLARLPGGDEAVVKVQRPHIESIVETDLAALRVAKNWLKLYRPITRRANLNQIYDEFARTTRAEVDFAAEARNAERFGTSQATAHHRLQGIPPVAC